MARKVTRKTATEPVFVVEAKLEFAVDGEKFADTYKVHYRGLSAARMRDLDDVEGEGVTEKNRSAVARQLGQLVVRIDDVQDDENAELPAKTDTAFFDEMILPNLKSVFEAIKADIDPPKAKPASSLTLSQVVDDAGAPTES